MYRLYSDDDNGPNVAKKLERKPWLGKFLAKSTSRHPLAMPGVLYLHRQNCNRCVRSLLCSNLLLFDQTRSLLMSFAAVSYVVMSTELESYYTSPVVNSTDHSKPTQRISVHESAAMSPTRMRAQVL